MKVYGYPGVINKPIYQGVEGASPKVGHVSVLEANVKVNPVDLGVEVSVSGINVEVEKGILVSTKAAVVKGKASIRKGVEAEAVVFEAGVGVKAGPAKAKVLFGLSWGVKFDWDELKFKGKGAVGIGGELEVDVGSMLFRPRNVPTITIELPKIKEEVSTRFSYSAREDPPPPPPKRKPTPNKRVKYSEAFDYLGHPDTPSRKTRPERENKTRYPSRENVVIVGDAV